MRQHKSIRLSGHALQQLSYRGVQEDEVLDCIRKSSWEPAELGRFQCTKDYIFQQKWNGVYFTTKRVRPIFSEEIDELVGVTVYAYYF